MFVKDDIDSKFKYEKRPIKADKKGKLYVNSKGKAFFYLGANPQGDNFYLMVGSCIAKDCGKNKNEIWLIDGALRLGREGLSNLLMFVYGNCLEEQFILNTGSKVAVAVCEVATSLTGAAKLILKRYVSCYSSFEYTLEHRTPTNKSQLFLIRDLKYTRKSTGEELVYLGFQFFQSKSVSCGKHQDVHLFYKVPNDEASRSKSINPWLNTSIQNNEDSAFVCDVEREDLEYTDKLYAPTSVNNNLLLSLVHYDEDSDIYDEEEDSLKASSF